MQCIQSYGNSSSSDSESDNGESTAHLRPIDTASSVAKTLTVMAAPAVVPLVNIELILNLNINIYESNGNITSIVKFSGPK